MGIVISIIYLAVIVVVIMGCWKMFTKAGEPGIACIIPIWSTIVLLKMAGRPWTHIFLFLIPIYSIVVAFQVWIEIARRFGKETGFGIGLALLGMIFVPILGFGDAQYQGGEQGANLDAFGTAESNPNKESDEIQPAV